MIKIDREKIVKAVVGSARLEGYKGTLGKKAAKNSRATRPETRPKETAKS
jgi:hypothetical protein